MKKYAIYQPKGSMCVACKHAQRDCSFLDFSSMKVAKVRTDTAIVFCSVFDSKSIQGTQGEGVKV